MNNNTPIPTINVTHIILSFTSSLPNKIIEVNGIGHNINIFYILSIIYFVPSKTKFYYSHLGSICYVKTLELIPAVIIKITGPIKYEFRQNDTRHIIAIMMSKKK